jgi:thiol-disulfide isomerase/thioredoxin
MPVSKHISVIPVLFLCNILFAQPPQFASYDPDAGGIDPLNVGDYVPDIEIDNVIYHTPTKVRLSDFKDKLILLDFWGTTCGSCIAALPGLDSLQKKYKDRIQVITVTKLDSKEKVISTLQRNSKTSQIKLPIVIADDILHKYFPYQLVSHAVWIDKNRKLRAITGIEYVTDENIRNMLADKEISWPVKKDIPVYDYEKPLLDMPQKELVKPRFLYYSAFTGYLDGIAPPNGRKTDPANKTVTVSFYNMGLLALSKIALDYKTGANLKEFILEVKDSTRIVMPGGAYISEWNKANKYCYTITLPIHISEPETEEIVKKDLLRWLDIMGYTVKKEKRKVNCFALIRKGKTDLLYSKGGQYINDLDNTENVRALVNAPLSTFINFLSKRLYDAPRVINETGIADQVHIDIYLTPSSLENTGILRNELSKYGLDLVPMEKEKEMYIITENGFKKAF